MTKVLFVLSSLEYGGAARQLTLLAQGLPRERFTVCVCVLRPGGPLASALTGVRLESLGWTRLVDLRPFWRWHELRRSFRPDIIQALGPRALRMVSLTPSRGGGRIIAAFPFPGGNTGTSALDHWLLRRAARVVVTGAGESERCRGLGVQPGKLAVIPLGIEPTFEPRRSRAEILGELRLDPTARYLACVGPLEPHKGFLDALWAFDILKYLYEDLHLLLIGTGSERERLQRFRRVLGARDHIHLVGRRAEARALLAEAEVVWVPSRSTTGQNVILEAMSVARPVVASRLPGLAEIVDDGVSGFLIPPGAKVALARQTRLLLENGELRRRLGSAAQERAARHFAAADMVRRFAELYEI